MLKKCFFWGACGQAKVLNEFIGDFGYKLSWLFDNNPDIKEGIDGIAVLGGWKPFLNWSKKQKAASIGFLVAIGGEENGKIRHALQKKISGFGFKPLTVWHKTSYIARSARVGDGSQILIRAVVGANAHIGEACIVNTGAQVDHDCFLEEGVHVMPGATITGGVCVKKYATVGSGAIILPKVTIGEGAIIGAGAVVAGSIKPYTVAVGIPAKAVRKI